MYDTSENLFFEATNYLIKTKTPFNVNNFFWDIYEVQKKGTGYVMGTLVEWRNIVPKGEGHLMSFIVRRTSRGRIDVGITRNKIFLTPSRELRTQTKEAYKTITRNVSRFLFYIFRKVCTPTSDSWYRFFWLRRYALNTTYWIW